jgi:hypothetical protein
VLAKMGDKLAKKLGRGFGLNDNQARIPCPELRLNHTLAWQ